MCVIPMLKSWAKKYVCSLVWSCGKCESIYPGNFYLFTGEWLVLPTEYANYLNSNCLNRKVNNKEGD